MRTDGIAAEQLPEQIIDGLGILCSAGIEHADCDLLCEVASAVGIDSSAEVTRKFVRALALMP